MDNLAQLWLLGEVVVAMLLGGVVGLERETAEKPAGFRTHMMVAGAAALVVGIGHALVYRFGEVHHELIRADPFRIISAVVTGVSFLGAGTIIRRGEQGPIEGLTTAASLLLTASVGVAVGLRLYLVAFGVVGLTLIALRGIRHFETRLLAAIEHGKHGKSPSG